MKTLFDATVLSQIGLKNRLIRSATWEAMADGAGRPTDRLLAVYRALADGGVGLIITGATFVTADWPEATLPPTGHMYIHDDSYIADYRRLTDTVHQGGCPVVMQLAYSGKPGGAYAAPATLSQPEIRELARAFGLAARRAELAGFDGVQIHAAHGFLLSQFLHPAKNARTDEYGGSLANRSRLLLEIYGEIRRQTGPDFPVLVKIDGTDSAASDAVTQTSAYVCSELAGRGLAAVEVSAETGAARPEAAAPYQESVFRDYAAWIAAQVPVPILLVGLNRSPVVMENLLNTTPIAYFSLSRPLIREPDLVNRWRTDKAKIPACISCNGCFRPTGNICAFQG